MDVDSTLLSSVSLDATRIGRYGVASVGAIVGLSAAAAGDGVAGSSVASVVWESGVIITAVTSWYVDW